MAASLADYTDLASFEFDKAMAELDKGADIVWPMIMKGLVSSMAAGAAGTDPSEVAVVSASPTACLLRGYGRAGTQNDRLGEAVILSTRTPIPVLLKKHAVGDCLAL